MNLQHDAAEAIRIGMKEVDELIRKRTKKGQARQGTAGCAGRAWIRKPATSRL